MKTGSILAYLVVTTQPEACLSDLDSQLIAGFVKREVQSILVNQD